LLSRPTREPSQYTAYSDSNKGNYFWRDLHTSPFGHVRPKSIGTAIARQAQNSVGSLGNVSENDSVAAKGDLEHLTDGIAAAVFRSQSGAIFYIPE